MNDLRDKVAKSIEAIHAAPQKLVIEFAGAGSQALAWLHGVGGSSRTILEAGDRYAATSLIDLIGFEPEQFASVEVARAMATKAFIRAAALADPSVPVAGLGCTATIATDRVKRGEHRACIVVCDAAGVTSYTLALAKGRRSRQEEETLVSLLMLEAVAAQCQVTGLPGLDLSEGETLTQEAERVSLLARLLSGGLDCLVVSPDGHMTPKESWPNIALLSGAFNPLHEGHRQMVQTTADLLQQDVYFELPLINADKGPIEQAEAQRRIDQFAGLAPVILTRAPLFGQKAQLFPHSVFVLGADTAARLNEIRFYNNDLAEMRASFEAVRRAGCHFLVAGRLVNDHFMTLKDVDLPAGYRELFKQIPEERFRLDISSTAIRQSNGS